MDKLLYGVKVVWNRASVPREGLFTLYFFHGKENKSNEAKNFQ